MIVCSRQDCAAIPRRTQAHRDWANHACHAAARRYAPRLTVTNRVGLALLHRLPPIRATPIDACRAIAELTPPRGASTFRDCHA